MIILHHLPSKEFDVVGYCMVGSCINCGHTFQRSSIHNRIQIDNQKYDELMMSIIEAANCIGIGYRKLRILLNIIDLPFIANNTYMRYE